MSGTGAITLPAGLWIDGACHREAELRPMTGSDEAFLLEAGEALLPAAWTTALLARCVTRLGSLRAVSEETARALTVGDREALLLHLRRRTLGERLQCVLRCPAPECGEKMDLELPVGEMLLPPYQDSRAWHETTVGENGASYAVRFRLPTGADQEAAAALAQRDPGAAAEQLLRRCVERVAPAGEPDTPLEAWPSAVAEQIPARMAALDPQAELELSLVCPECGDPFSALFDAAAYFARELAGQTRHLYREVHLLAFHYHWSEAEIMAMTGPKRRLYLELLAEELDRERSA